MNDRFRRFLNSPMGILFLVILIMGPVRSLLSGGVQALGEWFMEILYMIPAVIIAMSFHEYAHAKVADLCGDPSPKYNGRVTLDPRAHIDPVGLICLFFFHFGWGKPVLINPANFKKRRRDSIFVGLAGVTANFVLAVVFGFVFVLYYRLFPAFFSSMMGSVLARILGAIVSINLSLMLFNLLPVPPLDGFGVICDIFKLTGTKFYFFMQRYGSFVLLLIFLTDLDSLILSPALSGIYNGIISLWWSILF